jgi:molybdenum cofactor synthesis domain-containing protein
MKVAFLIIGDEILCGKTKDANLQTLALKLEEKGHSLTEVRVVADEETAIIKAIKELSTLYEIVFTSGGIGSTHDDITTESIAKAFGASLKINPEAMKILANFYKLKNLEFNAERQKMAVIPDGALLVHNNLTFAPGFVLDNVYVFAGIPQIFNAMLEEALKTIPNAPKTHSLSIETTKVTEGNIAHELRELQAKYTKKVAIGSYPKMHENGSFSLQITFRSTNLEDATNCKKEAEELIRSKI